MTLTDEELAEIEVRLNFAPKGCTTQQSGKPCDDSDHQWMNDAIVLLHSDIPSLLSTLREERAEVKRLRGTLERIIDEASDPAPDLYTMTMVIRLARAALSQPSKEGTG